MAQANDPITRLERELDELTGGGDCQLCKGQLRCVVVAHAKDDFVAPAPCKTCDRRDYLLIVTGIERLPGDPLKPE